MIGIINRHCLYTSGAGNADNGLRGCASMVAGARLSTVGADTIRQFAEIADQTLAAEAIDLLLRKASLDPKSMITAWRLHDDGATWIAVAGQI